VPPRDALPRVPDDELDFDENQVFYHAGELFTGVAYSEAIGEYRLFRQAAGRGAFAHVTVDVIRGADPGGPAQVGWAADPGDPTSAQPEHDGTEIGAALAGATDAVQALCALGIDTAGCRVDVTWLGISLVDTEPSAVRAAACAATADAFGAGDRFEVGYDGGWHCRPRPA
jgi:hypothetical protein